MILLFLHIGSDDMQVTLLDSYDSEGLTAISKQCPV